MKEDAECGLRAERRRGGARYHHLRPSPALLAAVACFVLSTYRCSASAPAPTRASKREPQLPLPTSPTRIQRHAVHSVHKLSGGARSIKFGDPIPLQISRDTAPSIRELPPDASVVKALKGLFEERAVWSTLALRNSLEDTGVHTSQILDALPSLAYKFRDGPWASLWVRRGYDPCKDPASCALQSLYIQLDPEALERARVGAPKRHVGDHTLSCLPKDPRTVLQLCDIADAPLARILSRACSDALPAASITSGWLRQRAYKEVSERAREICERWMAGADRVPPEEEEMQSPSASPARVAFEEEAAAAAAEEEQEREGKRGGKKKKREEEEEEEAAAAEEEEEEEVEKKRGKKKKKEKKQEGQEEEEEEEEEERHRPKVKRRKPNAEEEEEEEDEDEEDEARPYACSTCGKSFAQRRNIARHMQNPGACARQTRRTAEEEDQEEGGSPHKARNAGGREALARETQRAHQEQEEGGSPHKAGDAGGGEGRETEEEEDKARPYARTKLPIDEARPYACILCGMAYAHKSSIQRHMRTAHGYQGEEEQEGGSPRKLRATSPTKTRAAGGGLAPQAPSDFPDENTDRGFRASALKSQTSLELWCVLCSRARGQSSAGDVTRASGGIF
ncbi:RNA polymerase III transcription factor IIIC subunit-domain-containing protein [Baffinella frigidus]|nr:RNA polymerase III transcription factor IIIC subunit-domain-containing protein [Cryptophyta sp. CCMP2293]